jgi:hypothetical protein
VDRLLARRMLLLFVIGAIVFLAGFIWLVGDYLFTTVR